MPYSDSPTIDIGLLEAELLSQKRSVYERLSTYSHVSDDFVLKKVIEDGDLLRVELYFRCGASLNPKTMEKQYDGRRNNWFPLLWASQSGQMKIVELMLQLGADVKAKGGMKSGEVYRRGITALRVAVEKQNVEMVHKLLSVGACPESYEYHHKSAKAKKPLLRAYCFMPVLWQAVKVRNVEIMELLLTQGAKANLPAYHNLDYSYLTEAIKAESPPMVALLLRYGADANFKVPELKTTPLIMAARAATQAIDICKLLAQHGADLNAYEIAPKKLDALTAAVIKQDPELVRLLLELGARAHASDSNPLLEASTVASWTPASVEIVNMLIDHGAQVNGSHSIATEPLFAAVTKQHTEIAEALLKRGAQVDVVHADTTPLKQAVQVNQREMVQLLMSYGAASSTRVFAPAMASHGSEVCCSALDLAKDRGASPEIIAILNGSTPPTEPAPSGDEEEKRPAVNPLPPSLAASISHESAGRLLQPIRPVSAALAAGRPIIVARAEVRRTLNSARLRITWALCQQVKTGSYCDWELITLNASASTPGSVIAKGRTPVGSMKPSIAASAGRRVADAATKWDYDVELLRDARTPGRTTDAAKAEDTKHCLRSCELRFKIKARTGLFVKTVGEASFELKHLEMGSQMGTTNKFLVELKHQSKRTGTLAFEMTY